MNLTTLQTHPKPSFNSAVAFYRGAVAYGFTPLCDVAQRILATTSNRVELFGWAGTATGGAS